MERFSVRPTPIEELVQITDYKEEQSYVQIYNNITGLVVFRKLFDVPQCNAVMKFIGNEWAVIKCVQDFSVDLVAEVSPEGHFTVNRQSGNDNQKFWFESGFLRNKAFPDKVVAVNLQSSSSKGYKLHLEDMAEESTTQRWLYHTDKKLLESGMRDHYVFDVQKESSEPWTLLNVYPCNGNINEQFEMIPDPFEASADADEQTEITTIQFDLPAMPPPTPTNICSITEVNDSSVPSQVNISQGVISTTKRTAEFHWDNETAVKANAKAKVGIPYVGMTEVELGVANTITVGSNSVIENQKEEKWEYSVPVTVPPHSTVKINITVSEGYLTVPFIATIRRGENQWKEKGKFIGVNSYGLNISIEESQISK